MKVFYHTNYEFSSIPSMTEAELRESLNLKENAPSIVMGKDRHFYSLDKVYVKKLKSAERSLLIFEALALTILSMGTFLFFAEVRENWASIFEGRKVQLHYVRRPTKDLNLDLNTEVASKVIWNKTNSTQNQICSTKKNITGKLKDSGPELVNLKSLTSKIENSQKMNFKSLLDCLSVEEGFNVDNLQKEHKEIFAALGRKWVQRSETTKLQWTKQELSNLLEIDEKELHDLFMYLQLFTSPEVSVESEALNWLFKAFNLVASNETHLKAHLGVKLIWEGRALAGGKANRWPGGMVKDSWELQDLSIFLAIKPDALNQFLEETGVKPEVDGKYHSTKINVALKTASNRAINTILEINRTQLNSLRFISC